MVQFAGNGDAVLVGLASWGVECGKKGLPAVFVRIDPFVRWVEQAGVTVQKRRNVVQKFGQGSEDVQMEVPIKKGVARAWFVAVCVVAAIGWVGVAGAVFWWWSRRRRDREHADLEKAVQLIRGVMDKKEREGEG